MNGATVSQFKRLLPTAPSQNMLAGKVPVKLKLKNYWDRYTVDDLNKLVHLLAGDPGLHLIDTGVGCIAVHLWCSILDENEVISGIIKTARSLKQKGVLQVYWE